MCFAYEFSDVLQNSPYNCIPCTAALYHIKVAQSISVCISQLGACRSYNFTSDVLAVDDVVSIQSDSSKE